ncbi:MAG TPA: DUF2905 domain-containing protein [Parachlamydiaceae bacterium]|nr:DUF2905 domain-containing protein [Parachlamydiaceae bacterium]
MNISYLLILCGIGLIIIGLLFLVGFPLGKLPGDIHLKGEKVNVYIPIVTSIFISLVLTILVNAVFWLIRK